MGVRGYVGVMFRGIGGEAIVGRAWPLSGALKAPHERGRGRGARGGAELILDLVCVQGS